jgi:hypothetical protein
MGRTLLAETINHRSLKALEANGAELKDFSNMIGRSERVGVSEAN